MVERKGAKTALLCTAGFRDVIELRRYVRVTTYELFADPPRRWCRAICALPVNERTRADGSVLSPVEAEEMQGDCRNAPAGARGVRRRLLPARLLQSGERARRR